MELPREADTGLVETGGRDRQYRLDESRLPARRSAMFHSASECILEEWLPHPARKAGGSAFAQVLVVDEAFGIGSSPTFSAATVAAVNFGATPPGPGRNSAPPPPLATVHRPDQSGTAAGANPACRLLAASFSAT